MSLIGTIGRVTVSIPVNGPGEVLLAVRGGSEAFAAWSDEPTSLILFARTLKVALGSNVKKNKARPRHSRVVVIDALSARSVLVTPSPV